MKQKRSYWEVCKDASGMLRDLQDRGLLASRRKKRLYGCGCYSLIWSEIAAAYIKDVVVAAEEHADGKLSRRELQQFRDPFIGTLPGSLEERLWHSLSSLTTAEVSPIHVSWRVRCALYPGRFDAGAYTSDQLPEQADLVRELFRNLLRPITFAPEWRTSTAIGLAQAMYANRDFGSMPILADALEEAGCDHPDVLSHCRDANGVHVRGCWVVDGVLGKM